MGEKEKLNIQLPSELAKRFNKYLLAVAQAKGSVEFGLKSKIGRMALEEWLDKHEDDLDAVN